MAQPGRALGIVAIVALLLAACGSTTSLTPSGEASASAAALAEATPLTPADLAHAVVQVLMISADGLVGTGSGTIIDPSGLILTNAHVATPSDVPSGHYDLLGRNCDHEDILSETDVDVTISKTLTYS